MQVFEIVVALLLVGAVLAAVARRIGAPYPALMALAGAALALMPHTPTVALDPELALALFVAPVLLDAAFDASPRDLRANWRPVASLALGAVALTVITVALVARALVPELPWAAAIALGAIVAPPDAAAATAVLKQLRPPHRLLVILEGESLFNDASALLVYRLAVGAAVSGTMFGWGVIPMLFLVTLGSILFGLVLARLTVVVIGRIHDVATSVIFQFVATFAVWILAERLRLSGIITTVVYAMSAARTASTLMPARIRIPSYAVWEVAVFVLNVLAFILVGLQLKPIIARLDRATLIEYARVASAVCAATILARIAWVAGATALSRWRHRPRGESTRDPTHALGLSRRAAVVVAWSGMRGTVTLAAALALPVGGSTPAFPYRELVLFTAFAVVLGTLVLQGMTLRPLMKRLCLEDDGSVESEIRLARVHTLEAAASVLAAVPPAESAALVRQRYALMLRHAEAELHGASDGAEGLRGELTAYADTVRAATAAERRRLSALRADGTIGDDAFHKVEEELDWADLNAERLLRTELGA
jgi:CPA1 family monovalent cation:H+ antiporter